MDQICGVVIDLFENINFEGPFRELASSLADFRLMEFNDRASSAIVRPLPGFVQGDAVRLWSDINFMGTPLDLGPGQYPDFRQFNFNDVASSMQCVRAGPIVVAQRQQTENLNFNLQIITPPGTTLVSVQSNTILNLTATGTFIGPTTVRVTGSFVDRIVVLIRDTATGSVRTATGSVTLPFTKTINFPELAGMSQANLSIVVTASNPTSSFTLAGNILSKNVRFNLLTQVIRRTATGQNDVELEIATLDEGDSYTIVVEEAPGEE